MLKLENLSKYYYSSSSVTCALRKINLEFKIGEFVAITGESGSGKTTLLNIISGLDSYEEGEFLFDGKQTSYFDDDDWEQYRKEQIAFIFQNYNLIDSYTVLENVIVAYIIDGYSYSEAKTKAKETLRFVGMEKDMHKKATKLSGGQKQRLAIARALAKNSNIIVADEPTGNLDAENGVAILKLLKKVSENKLVIIVTHNQAQIEPFITRRVRLHDGEVVNDEIITINNPNKEYEVVEKNNIKDGFKKAFNFSFLNIKSQPKKSFLMILLIFITTLSSFVFLTNFKMNLDDSKTKVLSSDLFTNFDDTRLLVKKQDNSIITDEILQDCMIDHVDSIEKYDYIVDCNYYRPGDYRMKHTGGWPGLGPESQNGQTGFVDGSSIILENQDKFMRSYLSLEESDLAAGRLPTGDFEMVVYSEDLNVIGTQELVFFRHDKTFGADAYYQYDFTIVGVLKEKTKQAYFSEDICKVMELNNDTMYLDYRYNEIYYGRIFRERKISFSNIVIDPYISGNTISLPATARKLVSEGAPISGIEEHLKVSINNSLYNYRVEAETTKALTVSNNAMGLSKDVFEYVWNASKKKTQFALFITDYAYVDDVRNELAKKGYESVSCYKISVTGYDTKKVILRYVNLSISIVALIVMNLVAILLGYTILKIKKNDYMIFKMIGMSNRLCKKINFIEVIFYGVLSNVLLIICVALVRRFVTHEYITEAFKFVRMYDYLIVLFLTLISMFALGRKYSEFLSKKLKATALKEEA